MKERRNLIEQAKQRCRLPCIQDNNLVIMTIALSISVTTLDRRIGWEYSECCLRSGSCLRALKGAIRDA
jgi:hypothetical protein